MHHRTRTLLLAGIAVVVVACSDDAAAPTSNTGTPVSNIVTFKATLSGANEVPANASTATGSFTATLDTVTNIFIYDLTFNGLSANVNNGHIHGPAAVGVNAGTTVNFNTLPGATFGFGNPSGAGHGALTLNAATQVTATVSGDSLKKLLFAGLTYVNIHTTAIPGGEIRGQITKQ
jgi:hypothetical protein